LQPGKSKGKGGAEESAEKKGGGLMQGQGAKQKGEGRSLLNERGYEKKLRNVRSKRRKNRKRFGRTRKAFLKPL